MSASNLFVIFLLEMTYAHMAAAGTVITKPKKKFADLVFFSLKSLLLHVNVDALNDKYLANCVH